MLPFSPTSGLLPVNRIDVRSDSIEPINTLTDRMQPKAPTVETSIVDEEVKTIKSLNGNEKQAATPKTVVF
jgi:hypothetical protein